MKMSPSNIILLVGAIIIGVALGMIYPMFSILLLIPVIAFFVIVLMRNKGVLRRMKALRPPRASLPQKTARRRFTLCAKALSPVSKA